jgi:uncharacterized protein YijF (DUF1287 family)
MKQTLARAARGFGVFLSVLIIAAFTAACRDESAVAHEAPTGRKPATPRERVIAGAIEQTTYTFKYDPAYVRLAYPMGDVPRDRGVCSDVIVRAFRNAGVDLQKEVHEDMRRSFSSYPRRWGARRPDPNIDHRRVYNLMTYFERKGKALPTRPLPQAVLTALPGDVVAWDLGNNLQHIGLVTDVRSESSSNLLIVHNIGSGARLEDVLFAWRIIGHYRFFE